jgi:hypothetical protein
MNIISFNLSKLQNLPSINKTSNTLSPTFGLRMASPLTQDTVSFTAKRNEEEVRERSDKTAKCRSEGISQKTAMEIRERVKDHHYAMKKKFVDEFGDLLSTPEQKGLLTMGSRIKGVNSICEKSANRGWSTKKDVLNHMGDLSGFCFILESPKSEKEFFKHFTKMYKQGAFNVEEIEYHRIEPKYKNNEVVESFDSFHLNDLQKFKTDIAKIKQPTKNFFYPVDSQSGYSGLHVTISSSHGAKSEVQIMTRGVHNLKNVENLLYKIRNGKDIQPQYAKMGVLLSDLKVKDKNKMTPQEKARQAAMSKYTLECYKHAIKHPFADKNEFLHVRDAESISAKEKNLIKDFDMNSIYKLMQTFESIAKDK